MVVVEEIHQRVQKLSTPMQFKVLDFIEYLLQKEEQPTDEDERLVWHAFSLEMAMRGMEDEADLEYTLADLKGTLS